MAYTHIQCIGYQVPTVAKVERNLPTQAMINANPVPVANRPQSPALQPFPNTPQQYFNYRGDLENEYLRLHGIIQAPGPTAQRIIDEYYRIVAVRQHIENLFETWKIPSTTANGHNVQPMLRKRHFLSRGYLLESSAHLNHLQQHNIDAFNRVKRFLNVLNIARRKWEIYDRSNTLKVFLAPEFYFRPEDPVRANGLYRAYDYDTYKAIKEVLKAAIQTMRPLLRNWLIIPGTIMWYAPAGAQPPGTRGVTPGNPRPNRLAADTYFNSCFWVYYNSMWITNWGQKREFKVEEKAEASGIDGVPLGGWNGVSAPQAFPRYEGNAKKRKHLFNINGLKAGLEICLEHTMNRYIDPTTRNKFYEGILVDALNLSGRQRDDLHLQLLTAGGMEINNDSVVLGNNGVFFRNDGYADPPYVECKIEDNGNLIDIPNPPDTRRIDLTVLQNIPIEQPAFDPRNERLLPGIPFNHQQLFIYPRQKI